MRKFIAILVTAIFPCMFGLASAQTGGAATGSPATSHPPVLTSTIAWTNVPPGWTNHPGAWTNAPAALTNILSAFTNALRLTNSVPLGTNNAAFTNSPPPAIATNSHPHSVPPGPGGASKLPPNVQTVVQQFNQERAKLIDALKNGSDAQRQQILQQLAALREQLQDEMAAWRQQAHDQALEMKNQFHNNFAPVGGNQGSSGPGTGRPGHP